MLGWVLPFPIREARRSAAVPAGRLGYDLNAPALLLHTVQGRQVFDLLCTNGKYEPDLSLALSDYADNWPELVEAYHWMSSRMSARLPTTGVGAVWFYGRVSRANLAYSVRHSHPGQVLLTCRIARERVLLSHYDEWHSVLNRAPLLLARPDEDEESYFARYDTVIDALDGRLAAAGLDRTAPLAKWPPELRIELEASWEAIFEPRHFPKRGQTWQATAHWLTVNDVIEAVRLLP